MVPAFKNLTIKIDESEVKDKSEVKDMSLKIVLANKRNLLRDYSSVFANSEKQTNCNSPGI